MRQKISKVVFLGLFLLLRLPLEAAASDKSNGEKSEFDSYQHGVQLYADGKPPQALAIFKKIVRKNPKNQYARAAIARVESEIGLKKQPAPDIAASAKLKPGPAEAEIPRYWTERVSEKVDDFLIVNLPRSLNFNHTLGDFITGVGTLQAVQGRVNQLLAERKFALAKNRPFSKEKELRALVRRMPAFLKNFG